MYTILDVCDWNLWFRVFGTKWVIGLFLDLEQSYATFPILFIEEASVECAHFSDRVLQSFKEANFDCSGSRM
jgi:hypothetical protein